MWDISSIKWYFSLFTITTEHTQNKEGDTNTLYDLWFFFFFISRTLKTIEFSNGKMWPLLKISPNSPSNWFQNQCLEITLFLWEENQEIRWHTNLLLIDMVTNYCLVVLYKCRAQRTLQNNFYVRFKQKSMRLDFVFCHFPFLGFSALSSFFSCSSLLVPSSDSNLWLFYQGNIF